MMEFFGEHLGAVLTFLGWIVTFTGLVAVNFYKTSTHHKVLFSNNGSLSFAPMSEVVDRAHVLELQHLNFANAVERRLTDTETNCARIGELERIVADIRKRQESNANINLTVPNHTYICGEASSRMQLFIVDKLDSLKEKLLEDIKKIHNGE